jgi:hypothetical protein
VDTISSRQDQVQEKLSDIEEKIEELLHGNNHKEKRVQHIKPMGHNQKTKPKD